MSVNSSAAAAAFEGADSAFTVRTAVDCPEGGVGPFMQPCSHPGQGLSLTQPGAADHDLTVTGNPVVEPAA